jgi:methionine--tRNA ligase beta chain
MTLEEFQKADLRVGKILAADRVDGSEKLLKLQLDLGAGVGGLGNRQIVSGIAKQYAPEDLIGKQVVVIANLDPRTMMGLESQGMLLAAHGENGVPVVVVPHTDVPPGSKIA